MESFLSGKIFIFAGEQSADYYGALLYKELKKHENLTVFGVGGPKMRSLGFKAIEPMESFQITCIRDYLFQRVLLKKKFTKLINTILLINPSQVVLIDYPGGIPLFADKLKKRGYKGKIIQYICPSLIFFKKSTQKLAERSLDHLLYIFPFEASFVNTYSIPSSFVGHPILEKIKDQNKDCEPVGKKSFIGIFPGSRIKLLASNFPSQYQAAKKLQSSHPHLIICVSIANKSAEKFIKKHIEGDDDVVLFNEDKNYKIMRGCKLAIATSGTIALELALHKVPTVITYGGSIFDVMTLKIVTKWPFPFYCLVNILAQKEIFPELIYKKCNPSNIFEKIQKIVKDEEHRNMIIDWCDKVEESLRSNKNHDNFDKLGFPSYKVAQEISLL
jgi:lipid-A-disaccharide synthase